MTPHTPLASALVAAVLGLAAVALTVRVIVLRVKTGVQAGDGGHAELAQAIRAHANFAEQVPLALLLLVLSEALGTPAGLIYALGGLLIVARLASAFGLSRSLGPTQPRQAGAGLTAATVVVTALSVIYRIVTGV
jgi:uncharacterized membrane protein YecN with MAPEG domain